MLLCFLSSTRVLVHDCGTCSAALLAVLGGVLNCSQSGLDCSRVLFVDAVVLLSWLNSSPQLRVLFSGSSVKWLEWSALPWPGPLSPAKRNGLHPQDGRTRKALLRIKVAPFLYMWVKGGLRDWQVNSSMCSSLCCWFDVAFNPRWKSRLLTVGLISTQTDGN